MLFVRKDRQPSNALNNLISYQARVQGAKGKRYRLKKTPKQRPPTAQQREYYWSLQEMTDELASLVAKVFSSQALQAFVRSATTLRPDAARKDDFIDDLGRTINQVKTVFYQKWSDEKIQAMAEKAAKDTNAFNKKQFDKTIKQVVGVNVTAGDPWLNQEVKAFTAQNVELIKSIPDEHFKKLQRTIIQDVTTGKLPDDMIEDIQKIADVSDSKAKLIARDQTAKFNGTLNELRQKDVGIEEYEWSTSGDVRVRPEHEDRDGKTFRWDDPPEDGHPGIPINCRCVAIPIFTPPPEPEEA